MRAAALLALVLMLMNPAVAQDPRCGFVGVSTFTTLYELSGPSEEAAADTVEVVGPAVIGFGDRGACVASCTLGPSGTCAANTFPTMSHCTTPPRSCQLFAGQTALITSVYSQVPRLALLSSVPNPSIVGMPVRFTAIISASAPSGTFTFRDAISLAAIPDCVNRPLSLAGVATCEAAFSAAGSLNVSAHYSGDVGIGPTSSAPITQLVKRCDLDVDASSQVTGTSDGVMILRRLLGLSGAPLIAPLTTAVVAARTTPMLVEDWIDAQRVTSVGGNRPLDLDDNGVVEAASDGLILLRALLGFRGASVTQDALGVPPLGRNDWSTIRNHLNTNCGLALLP
jgi:Bacterial Ig-like domain (group 3)